MYFSAVKISCGITFHVRKLRLQRSERRGRADLGTLKLWHLKFHGRAQLRVACSYLGFNFDCISADREACCSTGTHIRTTCQYSRLSLSPISPRITSFLPHSPLPAIICFFFYLKEITSCIHFLIFSLI